MGDFTIVKTWHPNCAGCAEQTKSAIVMARVTGSNRSTACDGLHRAIVVRNPNKN